jgi:hypothetical protein
MNYIHESQLSKIQATKKRGIDMDLPRRITENG